MKNANGLLSEFTGDLERYKHLMGIIITPGVKYAADEFICYWFLDIIVSYQIEDKFKDEHFQTWGLNRIKDDEFSVVATDGNDNILVTQKIPFSDFEYDELTMWLVDKTILLPSEY